MTNEDQFKDSLKKLVESKEFPFDEDNWEKAAALIRPAGGSGKKFIISGIAALLLFLSGVLAYYYLAPSTLPVVAEKIKTTHPAHAPVNTPATSHQITSASGASGIHASAATETKKSNAAKSLAEPAMKPNDPAGSLNPSHEKAEPATGKPLRNTPAVIAPVHINQPINTVVKSNATAPIVIKGSSKQTPASTTDKKSMIAGNKPLTNSTSENETSQAGNTNTSQAKDEEPLKTTEAAKAEPAAKPSAAVTEQTTTPADLPAQAAVTETTAATQNSVATAVAKPDTVLKTDPDRNFPVVQKKILFSFEAGADYLTGWKNPGSRDANGFNPVIGINYFNYVTDKLAVSVGVQYTSVSHLDYVNHVSKTTYYDLGAESAVTVITPQKVHYLAVPVKLNYSINDKNTIGFGCNIAYLLTIDSKVETYNQHPSARDNIKIYSAKGYTQGFKTFDTQLSLFYRRKIYKNISVNAEVIYGLTDIKDNKFFNSAVFERNKGLKLTLVYNLFK